MTTDVRRGTLAPASSAPEQGEDTVSLLEHRNLVVEHILSGRIDEPVDYLQEQDEWVMVLAGAAELDLAGHAVALTAGDWVFLPAGAPHRLVRTEPGTSWLAVHLHPDS